ncbi:MAG: 30S ribosomal protein S16 [Saprospiraceae bacterium]|nr:MAG: 30S ribosomal protein S16 [Saprospiraceae bacterium]
MAVKIRLQRKGKKHKAFYHIVVADARAPRDGRFIEKIGSYNPLTIPATIEIDTGKANDWLMKGAQPTDTVRAMLRFKGVLYKKHLLRGVQKGVLTEEAATKLYEELVAQKEAKFAARKAITLAAKAVAAAKVAGLDSSSAPKKRVPKVEVAEAVAETEETPVEVVTAEAPAAPAVEETVETPAETPAAEETVEAPADASSEEK